MKDAKSLVEFFSAMSAVDRFSQYRLINPESILEHTGMVAITTMFICDKLDIGESVELRAIRHALCHDMDEILTGDIPMPTKYHSEQTKVMIDQIADSNARLIESIYEVSIYSDWSGHGQDYFIVKMADVMAVFYKVYQEVELFGNKPLISATALLADALQRACDALCETVGSTSKSNLAEIVKDMIDWVVELRGEHV